MAFATSPQASAARRHSPLHRKDGNPMNRAGDPMSRMDPTTPAKAVGAARDMVTDVVARLVEPGNMAVTMSLSPTLSERTRALVSIAIQARQECGPCLAFHESTARSAGADEIRIEAARLGTSPEPAVATLIEMALAIHASSTTIMAGQVAALRNVGYTNREIADAVLVIAHNVVLGTFHGITDFHADHVVQPLAPATTPSPRGAQKRSIPAPLIADKGEPHAHH